MKFKELLSKFLWFHKKFWGPRYVVIENDKVIKYLLIYHKRIYVLNKEDYAL
mgnify:FL=1